MTRQEILEQLAKHRSALSEFERALRYDFDEASDPLLKKEDLQTFSHLIIVANAASNLAFRVLLKALSLADQHPSRR